MPHETYTTYGRGSIILVNLLVSFFSVPSFNKSLRSLENALSNAFQC